MGGGCLCGGNDWPECDEIGKEKGYEGGRENEAVVTESSEAVLIQKIHEPLHGKRRCDSCHDNTNNNTCGGEGLEHIGYAGFM